MEEKPERYKHPTIKHAKRMIIRGNYKKALEELEKLRGSKLGLIEYGHSTPATSVGLSKINSLLGECCSLMGKRAEADEWFRKAFRHLDASQDKVLEARLIRQEAMHQFRFGNARLASTRLASAGLLLGSLPEDSSVIPMDRLEVEFYFTVVCQADVDLSLDHRNARAKEWLLEALPCLTKGSKKNYELYCLMALIKHGHVLDPKRGEYIARAAYLNQRYIRNFRHAGFLLSAFLGPDAVKASIRTVIR